METDLTIRSLFEPATPKKACHVCRSLDATASRIIVGTP
jgi:hypothetical protein